jgi:uncharacterized protein (DUF1501 family)
MSHAIKPEAMSRRGFLANAGRWMTLGVGGPMSLQLSLMGAASAQGATDYKALVCVYLGGGNDAFNTLLATDTDNWAAYTAARGANPTLALLPPGTAPGGGPSISEQLGGVLSLRPVDPLPQKLALHPTMTAARYLFNNQRRLSMVANIGTLIEPTTKSQYMAGGHPLPPKLGSHNDQESMWLALGAEGARHGWAGRMVDLLASTESQTAFAAISTAGRTVWSSGPRVQTMAVTTAGGLPFGTDAQGLVEGSAVVADVLKRVSSRGRSHKLIEAAWADVAARSQVNNARLTEAMPDASFHAWAGTGIPGTGASVQYVSPVSGQALANPLALQLQTVARAISASASGALDTRRQVIFVRLNGFDTHNNQASEHTELLAQLDHGMAYFDATLRVMGMQDQVTLFTASEFGRSFTCNDDGTDHGWGGHHFVLGGAVRGGKVVGRYPNLGFKNANDNRFDSSDDQVANGALLPALAVEQLAAEFGQWMGLSYAQCQELMPRLGRFPRWQSGLFG